MSYAERDVWRASTHAGRHPQSMSMRLEILRDSCACDVCGRPMAAGMECAIIRDNRISRFAHTACAGMGDPR